MTRIATIALGLMLTAVPVFAQSRVQATPRTGSHSTTTGNLTQAPTLVEVVRVSSPGPYRRQTLGSGRGLAPHGIIYDGEALGRPAGEYPLNLVVEFCEEDIVNEALLSTKCPTARWHLYPTKIFSGANKEHIKVKKADDHWFDPTKKYVLIWREPGERGQPVRYSTPVTFKALLRKD